jgi:hypothetical protein
MAIDGKLKLGTRSLITKCYDTVAIAVGSLFTKKAVNEKFVRSNRSWVSDCVNLIVNGMPDRVRQAFSVCKNHNAARKVCMNWFETSKEGAFDNPLKVSISRRVLKDSF